MLQRFVDGALAVAKESVKTFTYESLNNIVRFINGVSALLLTLIPGKSSILEGMHGWELRPTFRGPRLPRWMENGVSSFNQFIHELSVDPDSTTSDDDLSGDEDNDEHMLPLSPMSQASRLSRANSFCRYDRRFMRVIKYLLSWLLWPITFATGLLLHVCRSLFSRRPETVEGSIAEEQQSSSLHLKKTQIVKDHIVQRTTDRRRGVVEDLQLAIEIFIEAVFDNIHKAVHLLLSPAEVCGIFCRWFSSDNNASNEDPAELEVSVPTATLGEDDPSLTEQHAAFRQPLNTDARTCQDVIRECGYPYEAIRVITDDGYVLPLERIPRRDSRKVVYLQHGILDSSLGWVSNGVVGSPAFAAFDQGYDVFLGNFRGMVSREHVNKKISSRNYWRYSVNQHGMQDVPAIIEKIHQIKTSELEARGQTGSEDENNDQPYKMCAICHSLGGAAMLMYIITRRIEEKPHRLSRVVLLSPAGFHEDSTFIFSVAERIFLLFSPVIAPFVPGFYIPTKFFRMLVNKLARDFHNYPALGGLVQTLMSYVVGGDTSNWVGALGLPHYNMYDMPGLSLHVVVHLAQMKRAKKFIMYDFGSAAANMEAYGSPEPLDLGQHYNLIDIPVDLVAGKMDHIIRPSMVRKHYRLMRRVGVDVSYNEYEYGHLDFTFSHREELLAYIMSRLILVGFKGETLKRSRRSQLRMNGTVQSTE